MKFIGGVFSVLKNTTWPTRKQSWHDFISILEYSAFFALLIFLFDKLLNLALTDLLNRF
ncbi:preprotein translocase subunit SecE [Streptococcus ratti]|uniref:Preprotein translocase subunit SecE n=2 Tax=Streptococcus ratti TaxID=1341 RepID=A0A7X9QG51_STRRT|nr:preprotein translocase subunit SecE [Streptococcus ratti]VEI59339.1 preprotein translocase subunit SecE [Streptococcus mutans]EJN94995.1 preprotein translocase subunit SecE [Streptococcus ratti FA-1 = DSM 20564]EMP69561.1 preprotein translocase subunit SecE [Streptococcus ratti FA-1 = DSM 20564]NMD49796.1 preprotein translocase subunit SecE [Streptococcus ratti]QEY06918.1 preprotein translocase subunit SecE [Streptococcus ratti]